MSGHPHHGANVILSQPSDWVDWYDSRFEFAQDLDLEDLVDLDKKKPIDEIILPKPEKPNPLALFPELLDALPPGVRAKVAVPVVDENGEPVSPAQYTLIRNDAIEDDAVIHLTAAQARGWSTRLDVYTRREKEWRNQRLGVLALRR